MSDAIEALKKDVLLQLETMRKMLTGIEDPIEQIDPMLVVRVPDGKLAAIMVPDFKECGDSLTSLIRQIVGHFAADRLFILAECWIRLVEKEKFDGRKPSECDDRKEAITIYMLDRDTSYLCHGYQIIERHADGKPYFPHEPILHVEVSGAPAGGRFPGVRDLWDITDSQNSERLN